MPVAVCVLRLVDGPGRPEDESDEEIRGAGTKKVCRYLPPRAELIGVLRQLGREWATASPGTRHPHGTIGPGTCSVMAAAGQWYRTRNAE